MSRRGRPGRGGRGAAAARAVDLVVLVDGSNIAHHVAAAAGTPGVVDAAVRSRLVDHLVGWAARSGAGLVVTFDGAGTLGEGTTTPAPHAELVATGSRSADAVLEQRAAELRRADVRTWLATDDAAVRQVAGAHAERVLGAADLVAEIGLAVEPSAGSHTSADGAGAPPATGGTKRVADTLDERTLARLERLRRGG